jgi:hypothetical protein
MEITKNVKIMEKMKKAGKDGKHEKDGNVGNNRKYGKHGNCENNGKYEYQFASVPELINGYGECVQSLFDDGFRVYLVTFKFNQIPGSSEYKGREMLKQIEYDSKKLSVKDVTINDGLHLHAIIAMPSTMRHPDGCKLKNLIREKR